MTQCNSMTGIREHSDEIMGPREEADTFPGARERKGRNGSREERSQEGMSKWGLDVARQEGHLPETDQVMGGIQGRMENGAQRKGPRLDTNGGATGRGRWAGRNPGRSQRCQPEGTSELQGQPVGAEAWGGRSGGWQAGGGEQWPLLQPRMLWQGCNSSARLFTTDPLGARRELGAGKEELGE